MKFDIANNLNTENKENIESVNKISKTLNYLNDKNLKIEEAQLSTALNVIELQKDVSMLTD